MSAEIPVLVVDAFTSVPFRGNPAAVCPLDAPRPAPWMQSVAAEMRHSETAFLVPEGDGWRLRWFTPVVEVRLCGHATLAAAHVLWETGRLAPDRDARFATASGTLTASRSGDAIALDFPALASEPADLPPRVEAALRVPVVAAARVAPRDTGVTRWIVELESAKAVRGILPDLAALERNGAGALIATAPGDGEWDIVSRYFSPWSGVDEDPVTGSAHCALGPYWAPRLGKTSLRAYQASLRGGELEVETKGDRVTLRGRAVTVVRGTIADG